MHHHRAAAASATLATRVTSRRAVLAGAVAATAAALAPRVADAAPRAATSPICIRRRLHAHRVHDQEQGGALENTEEGALRSLRGGFDGIQPDVWMTAPEPRPVTVRGVRYPAGFQQIVCVHDNTWRRTHGVARSVTSLTWAETARLRSLTGWPAASLAELVDVAADHDHARVAVQLKGTDRFDARRFRTLFQSRGYDHTRVLVYKSLYRPRVDLPILEDFARAGFRAGIKTVKGRLPAVGVFRGVGATWAAISEVRYADPAGGPYHARMAEYAAAGIAMSNLTRFGDGMVDDARWGIGILHSTELAKHARLCGAAS